MLKHVFLYKNIGEACTFCFNFWKKFTIRKNTSFETQFSTKQTKNEFSQGNLSLFLLKDIENELYTKYQEKLPRNSEKIQWLLLAILSHFLIFLRKRLIIFTPEFGDATKREREREFKGQNWYDPKIIIYTIEVWVLVHIYHVQCRIFIRIDKNNL